MVDRQYSDPRLVGVYDTLNAWSDDNEFYLRLPQKIPSRILDVGCGTGMLAVRYAETGNEVVGIDPAPEMVRAAKQREAASTVEWQVCKLESFQTAHRFDLIVMTGHAFQCLLTDEEISGAFRQIRRLLAHDGRFVFETRNPAAQAWQRWTPEHSRTDIKTADRRRLNMHHEVTEVDGDLVSFTTFYTFDDGSIESHSTLRFVALGKIRALAEQEGLAVAQTFGDWDNSALDQEGPEIISVLTHNPEMT